jgi:hypothetical protein
MPLVLGAIDQRGGVCSQREIVSFARQRIPRKALQTGFEDQIGLALGELFDQRAIATRCEDGDRRIYFRRKF